MVRNNQVFFKSECRSKAITSGAGTEGIVEREQARLDLRNGEAGYRAGKFFGKDQPFRVAVLVGLVGKFGNCNAIGKFQRRFQ